MSEELYCNFKKCRKALRDSAYITACSHVFCLDHGRDEIMVKNEKSCPACQNSLVNNFDVVKANLNPGEQFKSMVLAGHRPEIIMEIANRALLFWSYQQYQEHLQKDVIIKNLKESIATETENKKAEVSLLRTDLENLNRRKKELEKDLEGQKAKTEEIMEKINEKTRENQKLQALCEMLKKRQLSAKMMSEQQQKQNNRQSAPREIQAPQLGPVTMGGDGPPIYARGSPRQNISNHSVFDFRPETEDFPSPKVFIEAGYRNMRR